MFKSEEELTVDELNKFTIGDIVRVEYPDGWVEGRITDFHWDRVKGKWMYSYDELDGDGCDNDILEDRIEDLDIGKRENGESKALDELEQKITEELKRHGAAEDVLKMVEELRYKSWTSGYNHCLVHK